MKNVLLITSILIYHFHSIAQTFQWAKQSNKDVAFTSLEIDGSNSVYLKGITHDTIDLDLNTGVYNLSSNSPQYYFFAKYNNNGSLIWAKQFQHSLTAWYDITSLKVDANKNVYVMGMFSDTIDVDPNAGVNNLINNASIWHMYICKYDSNVNLIWAKQLGDSNSIIQPNEITINPQGEIFATGHFTSNALDFDPSGGVSNLNTGTNQSLTFILKLSTNGNFMWCKKLNGNQNNQGYNIVSDENSNTYLSGTFSDTLDANPNAGVTNLVGLNGENIFIIKLNNTGNLVWAKAISNPTQFAWLTAIKLQVYKNSVYYGGSFESTVDFDPNAGIDFHTSPGGVQCYLSKLDINGNYKWTKTIGTQFNSFNDCVLDTLENCYLQTTFTDTLDFDAGIGVYNLVATNFSSATGIAKYDSNGNFQSALAISGNGATADNIAGDKMAIDANQNIFMTGNFSGTGDFNPSSNTFNLTASILQGNLFLTKFSLCGTRQNISYTTCDTAHLFGNVYTQSGQFIVPFSSTNGCDSSYNVNLTLLPASHDTLNVSTCEEYTLNGTKYTQSGNYLQTFTNIYGCDSNYFLQLTLAGSGGSIIQNLDTLIAMPSGFVYQWINCVTNQAISGAINQKFVPASNGSYAVRIVFSTDCIDTLQCTSFLLNTPDIFQNKISLFPNPTTGKITIDIGTMSDELKFNIQDLTGRTLLTNKINKVSNYEIDLSEFANGIYWINMDIDDKKKTIKIVKN